MFSMGRQARPDLGILVALAFDELVRELHAALAAEGYDDVRSADGFVFRVLAEGPMTVSALAGRLGVTKQRGAQVVDDMESRGYVCRRADPDDARARPVQLTERGRGALAAAAVHHRRTERRLARRHGARAVASLRELLGSMAGEAVAEPRFRTVVL